MSPIRWLPTVWVSALNPRDFPLHSCGQLSSWERLICFPGNTIPKLLKRSLRTESSVMTLQGSCAYYLASLVLGYLKWLFFLHRGKNRSMQPVKMVCRCSKPHMNCRQQPQLTISHHCLILWAPPYWTWKLLGHLTLFTHTCSGR